MKYQVISEPKRYPTERVCPDCGGILEIEFHLGRPNRPFDVCKDCNKSFNSPKKWRV